MIHLDGETANEIAKIASKKFGKAIQLTVVGENPGKI
ncbi:hypothetical protein AWB78_08318 [Caballeronia calidae]|uniref:Uncharacterized protein n=1 Tax=Caballeronia calidae TaxID=1777139 RepID=A0A158EJ90_9BURK|nr:hypothetical protein AWB78_08318 [Caballeronia calidae]